MHYDCENDVKGRLESVEQGVVQSASQFRRVADSDILPKEDAVAMKPIAMVAQGQAAGNVKTNLKEEAMLGGKISDQKVVKSSHF